MKLIVFLIIILSLYLIYRLSFPKQAEKREGNKTSPPPDGDEVVVKRRFVLPDRSNPAQRDDRKEDSDKQNNPTQAQKIPQIWYCGKFSNRVILHFD
jgi:hypothetical protein